MRALHHIALRTRDIAKLRAFYIDIVGLTLLEVREAGSVWLQSDAIVLMLEQAGAEEPLVPEGSQEFIGFAVTQAEREAAPVQLLAAGVTVEHTTASTVYFRDPDGRRIGFSCYPFAHLSK
jgi:catechol 2,3-dioxygenase-like lactoylglutathione lyase family enzyme